MVVAGYKYRFYPTTEQKEYLAQTFGCVRVVYNKALEARKKAYEETGKGLTYNQSAALLTSWKKEASYNWLNDVSSVPLQQSLRHLQTAFRNFFDKRSAYPKFKSRRSRQSAEFTKSGFRLRGDISQPRIYLPKQAKPLAIRWSRDLPIGDRESPEVSSITITKDAAGRYHIVFKVKFEPNSYAPRTKAVGLDMGLTHAVITSDGAKHDNPKYLKQSLKKLARESRKLSRKVKGSGNWHRQRIKVAKVHARVRDQRQDWSHKLTTSLVRAYGTICIETLQVSNMVRNRKLSRAISDVSWFELRRQLAYKCKWYGGQLVAIDQWIPTSKTCSDCGAVKDEMPLQVRSWTCPPPVDGGCGAVHDRDVNAARNILRVGTTRLASGETVSPIPLAG